MPEIAAVIEAIPKVIEFIINTDFKELANNFSFIYYFSTFFYLLRVLLYFGVMFVEFVNFKFTTTLKTVNIRKFTHVFLKFWTYSSKKKFINAVLKYSL